MGKRPHRLTFFATILFLLWNVFPAILQAQPRVAPPERPAEATLPLDSFNLAVQAYNREDFGEALNLAQQAIYENPENLDSQYLLGNIYYKLQRFDEAEVIFQALIQRDKERFTKVHFDLANVLVQKGKEEEALVVIEKTRHRDPGRADYETGIIYMRLKRFADAIEPLKQAAIAKPELAAQATTQRAIAHYHLKNYTEAKQLLQEALELERSPEKAEQIRKMLQTLDAVVRASKPWVISATVGVQYDDNVFQTPLQQANFQRVRETDDDKDDVGFLTSVTGRYRFWQEGSLRAGAGYNHYSIVYVDHADLNAIGARPSLYLQWQRSPYLAELEYIYSHYWVDQESWLDGHTILPKFSIEHSKQWRTDLVSGVEWHLYQDETPDDTLYFVGATETYFMRDGKANIRGGYLLGYEHLVPEERADYRIHELMLGFQWPLWRDRLFADISGRYIFRDFNFDPAMNEDKKREDQEKDLNILLWGQLTPSWQVSFLFQHIWNDSNLPNPEDQDLFTYKRAVYTCMLTFNY